MGPFLPILAICLQASNTEVQWYGGSSQFEIELEKTETLFTIQKDEGIQYK